MRTQIDRDVDLALGRAIERKDAMIDQMGAALVEIREKAAFMNNGGAWAAGIATLCLATLPKERASRKNDDRTAQASVAAPS